MNSNHAQITQIIDLFNQNPILSFDPDKIASKMGLNVTCLQDILYDWAGITLQQFLKFLTVDFASQQLIQPDRVIENNLSNQILLKTHANKLKAINCCQTNLSVETSKIQYGTISSPFGSSFIATLENKICHLSFIDIKNPDKNINTLKKKWPKAEISESTDQNNQLSQALFNENGLADTNFSLLVKGTDFQIKVWKFLLLIPRGKLYSYGQVARAIGHPSSSRAVANAVGANPIAYLIPCHRVIRSSGALGGYHWGITCKQAILVWEFAKDFELNN